MEIQELIRRTIDKFVGAAEILLFEIMQNRDWQEFQREQVVSRLKIFMQDR